MTNNVLVWSGWVGGGAIGIYLLAQWWLTNRALGCSMGYHNACAIVSPTAKRQSDDGWRLWFILGIPLGGLVALLTTPGAQFEPHLSWGEWYDRALPNALWGKALVLTFGGVLMGVGARLAGGCPSGHTISGVSLLNVPSMIASVGFFIGGLAAVQLMFRAIAA